MTRRLLAVVAISLIAVWTPMPAQAGGETPFRMSGTVSESPVPDAACHGLHITGRGTLSGVPFGKAEWSRTECVDAAAEPGVFVIRDGRFVLKTKTGSLAGAYEGHASLPSTRGHVYAWVKFRIVKGTGAYKGVKGSGLLAADVDALGGTAKDDLSGTLTSFRPHR